MEGLYDCRQTLEGDHAHGRLMRLYLDNAPRFLPLLLTANCHFGDARRHLAGRVTKMELRSLTNFWAIVLGKIKIAIGAMKIHAGPEHVRIDHKDFLARRTRNLDRLTHFSSWCFFLSAFLKPSPASRPVRGSVHRNVLQHFSGHELFELDSRHGIVRALRYRRERPIQRPCGIDDHS